MINIQRFPDDFKVICDGENTDATVRFSQKDNGLEIYLATKKSQPKFVHLRWNYRADEPVRILGDRWERSYYDLTWKSLDGENFMPWYFLVNNGKSTVGCGVMTQPNSFVSFEYDSCGVSGWFDVRCGGVGVQLMGRELCIATVITRKYDNISAFDAACLFCKEMCPAPVLPKVPVYGGNNWYHAYGNSSAEEIYEDSKFIKHLSERNPNKPFMVIDDCWQPNRISGPYVPNEKFGDMKKVADEMKKIGVHPGIWTRFLHDIDVEKEHPEWLLKTGFLDPSVPEVEQYVRQTIKNIKAWGFELIKHDFSTVDIFGDYGFLLNGTITLNEGWSFHNKTKTGAEIVLDFYRAIREECGDVIVVGCNTLSHLSAGLVEIMRIGDDTSGIDWNRTRAMGVNTLAFRLPQNRAFYITDADCVGIIPGKIKWELNREWARILSMSGTPLFVSCANNVLSKEESSTLMEMLARASKQEDVAIPLDWEYNNQPQKWLINGEVTEFDFVQDSYPLLIDAKCKVI